MEETTRNLRLAPSLPAERARVSGKKRQHTLCNKSVQVLVAGSLDAKVATANVVDGLVIDHEGTVGVLKSSVSGKDRVVWLDNRGGDLRGGVDTELELALLAIVNRQTLHEESTETGTGAATERVENEESLETRAVVGYSSDLVEDLVDELLTDRVVTTGVVVRCILLARDHLLGVEEAAVGASAHLVDNIGFEIGVDGTGNIFAVALMSLLAKEEVTRRRAGVGVGVRTSLGEEGGESVVIVCGLALFGEVSIRLKRRFSVSNERSMLHFPWQSGDNIPGCRAQGNKAIEYCQSWPLSFVRQWHDASWLMHRHGKSHLPARVGNLATGLADYTRSTSVSIAITSSWHGHRSLSACTTTRGKHTVQADDFTHVD